MPRTLPPTLHEKSRRAPPRRNSRRPFWLGLLMVLVTSSMVAGLLLPKPAHAQFTDTGAWIQRAVRNAVDAARYVADKADKIIDKVSKKVGDVAFKNALKVFLGKIAEDTATWVASAGTGQEPLFLTDPHYFKDLGNAAAGDYLDSLSKEKFGVSLCDPGSFKVTLDIALRVNLNPNFCKESCQQNYAAGLDDEKVDVIIAPNPHPVLDMQLSEVRQAISTFPPSGAAEAVVNTWLSVWQCTENFYAADDCLAKYSDALARGEEKLSSELKQCNSMCSSNTRRLASCTLTQIQNNAEQGLLSSGLTINGRSTNITGATLQQAYQSGDLPKIFRPDQNPLGMFFTQLADAQAADAAKQQEEKDLLTYSNIFPLRSIISGAIKTPGSITTSAAQEGLSTAQASQAQTQQTGSPVADAFGIFTNTLTSKLIDRIFNGGLVDDKGNAKSLGTSGAISRSSGGVQAARDRFASLAQVSFGTGGGIDILNDLSACPTDVASVTDISPGQVQPNSCVLDPSFRQAIEEHLTVKEALARGLLSDQKPFGFDANGQEPDFRNGYPYRSLVVLRKYRIIPVGWELAAQHIRDFEKQNVSLSTIVSQFDDPTSAYYRLVDPSWVLKAPENICLRTGFTDTIASDEYVDADGDEGGRKNISYQDRYCTSDSDANQGQACTCDNPDVENDRDGVTPCTSTYPNGTVDPTKAPNNTKCNEQGNGNDQQATCAFITPRERQVQRQESCVDEQTCILENDDGTCKQYGTCVEERDTWRFNGQSCNALYASCATFTDPAGTPVSYLQNTLQSSVCGPDNAGCQQYCTQYNYTTNTWSCTVAASQTRRYDSDLQSCDPSAEGCTQFIRQTTGTNLVPNAGFELGSTILAAGNVQFDGWRTGDTSQTCGAQTFVSTDALSGAQAARVQWAVDCGGADTGHSITNTFNTGTPLASRTFTVSFNAKSEGAACVPDAKLVSGAESSPLGRPTVTPDWQRFSYAYTFLDTQTRSDLTVYFGSTPDCTYLLDNVQVEEGTSLTDYKDYGAVNLAHLKRPADGLACTGNTATDPAACSAFVTKCTADDVGCDLFTPVAGGANVPAKAGMSCPADKVGCASFREQPTSGVLDVHATRTGTYCANLMATEMRSCSTDADCGGTAGTCQPLVSFISTSGKQCSAQDVGCEAFTNLDDVAQGGEGKAQFTKLLLCVPPSYTGTLNNYYAWVGDDEAGYQLKKYLLVRSNLDAGPCTNLAHDSLACQDTAATVASCTAADFGVDPDCGQYYDDSGSITYRLRSRVIEQTENCHPYRNEVDSQTYYADSTRSLSCSVEAIGCREYVGNTGSNTRTLIDSNFENGSYSPWTLGLGSALTSESISFGGHSLRLGDAANGGQATVLADTKDLLQTGKTYVVKFWARSMDRTPNSLEVQLEGPAPSLSVFGTVALTTEWNQYTLGPVTYADPGVNPSQLAFRGLNGSLYLDNVTFTELTDSTYKVKGSQTVCGGYEGCTAYRNRAGEAVNLMSFAKLCQTEKVGCEALINTQNSSTPFAQTVTLPNLRGDVDGSGKIDQADVDALSAYLGSGGAAPFPLATGDVDASGSITLTDLSRLTSFVRGTAGAIASTPYDGDTVTTPADAVEYWVNDPAKSCSGEDKGCRALGKQQVNLKKSGTTYTPTLINTETVYAKDNPDAYTSILCGLEALSCEAYSTANGGTAYFRNPTGRACEYRDATGSASAGWYLQGTNDLCPIRNDGNIPPAVPTGGFAGLCPAEQNGCGTFLDPLGTGESLATNSGFETANTAGTAPQSWTPGASMQEYASRGDTKAVRLLLNSSGYFTQTFSLDANTYYVVSADVERTAADVNPVRIGFIGCRDALGAQVRLYSPDSSMISDNSGAYQEVAANRFSDSSFQRISGRVYSGNAVTCQVFAGTTGTGAGHWFDNLQVRVTTNTPVLRQTVDSASCNGQVGDTLGCRLFNDTSTTALTYDVDQSPLGATPTDADATGGVATCVDQPELCDSNVVLKVSRDRTCSQWLAPTTTIESTKSTGQKENLVLSLATCDSMSPSGQCNRYVDEKRCSNKPQQTCVDDSDCNGGTCKPFALDGNTQAYSREELRNRSGLVVAGLQFGQSCSNDRSKSCTSDSDCGIGHTCLLDQAITGKFPFGIASQVGGDGLTVTDELLNGTFSTGTALPTSGWTLASNGTPDGGDANVNADGSTAKLVRFDTQRIATGIATVAVDPYVAVTPSTTGDEVTTLRTANVTLASKLSANRTYMLSFNARYLRDPNEDVTDPRLTAGISSANSVSATSAWYGKVQPTTEWQRFVVGPLTLSQTASVAAGNTAGATHGAFMSDTGFVFIAADGTNRTPFAVDSVSLLPVLHVDDPVAAPPSPFIVGQQSGQAYVSRSCRAYPNSSALTCNYTDDTGKQFNGWQGYCVERDPQNPTICLSWYPLDLLAGDRNIFGTVQAAGYTDRSPLYACVQSSGNASSVVFDSSTSYAAATYTNHLYGTSYGYRRPLHASITAGCILSTFCSGTPTGFCGCTDVTDMIAGSPFVNASVGSADHYADYELERIEYIIEKSDSEDWPTGSKVVLDQSNSWSATWCSDGRSDNLVDCANATANGMYVHANFNATTHLLESFDVKMADWSGGGASAQATGVAYLREWCTQLVKVVSAGGENAVWSSKLASATNPLTNFRYLLGQNAQPYGTIAQPELNFDDPMQWDGGLGGPLQLKFGTSDARAGSTYSCILGRDCSQRYCSTNASNHCDTSANITKCTTAASAGGDGGYCLGSPPVKVCVIATAPAVSGQSCSADAECGTGGSCDYANASGSYVGTPGAKYANGTAADSDQDALDNRTMSRLRLLFANVYGATGWEWNRTTQRYEPPSGALQVLPGATGGTVQVASTLSTKFTTWQDAYRTMAHCPNDVRPSPTGEDLSQTAVNAAFCGIYPEVVNLAIGRTASETVFINSGENLQLNFNTIVDKEQLPLQGIAIDWDGNNVSDQVVAWGFAPLSSTDNPHSISHVYRYGDGLSECYEAGEGPYGTNATVGGHEYCVARPRVQVQDNWQWCNGGRCSGFPVNGDSNYWEQFGGNIIVVRR